MNWNYSEPPKDRVILRWHCLFNCPVAVFWREGIVNDLPWITATKNHSWPEEAFLPGVWMENLSKPIDGYTYVKAMPLETWKRKVRCLKNLVKDRQKTELITVRELAKILNIPQGAVLVLCEDAEYIVNNGFRVSSGHGELDYQGDWTVETN
ncbi:hypothetical protein [Lewinella sp. W8]|uniref:hypothetical protein n=1 Tax=Lewinella sp. W8 TaxID=2528208 RepID=UPI0010685270|nr:hypothetical protein [Lewinella sp. W8]MTB53023.1 hypothetical protein [Lewinella sp. W8]